MGSTATDAATPQATGIYSLACFAQPCLFSSANQTMKTLGPEIAAAALRDLSRLLSEDAARIRGIPG